MGGLDANMLGLLIGGLGGVLCFWLGRRLSRKRRGKRRERDRSTALASESRQVRRARQRRERGE